MDSLRTNLIWRTDVLAWIVGTLEYTRIPIEKFRYGKHDLLVRVFEELRSPALVRTQLFFPLDIGGIFLSAAVGLADEQPQAQYQQSLRTTMASLCARFHIDLSVLIQDWQAQIKELPPVFVAGYEALQIEANTP